LAARDVDRGQVEEDGRGEELQPVVSQRVEARALDDERRAERLERRCLEGELALAGRRPARQLDAQPEAAQSLRQELGVSLDGGNDAFASPKGPSADPRGG